MIPSDSPELNLSMSPSPSLLGSSSTSPLSFPGVTAGSSTEEGRHNIGGSQPQQYSGGMHIEAFYVNYRNK